MTLGEITQISYQAISTAALVASLIFVAIQLHRNTNATRAASHHAVSEALNRVNLLWAQNGEVAQIWLRGMEDRASLTKEERWRFDATARAYIHVCETMFMQALLGAGDPGIVAAEVDGIRHVFSSASVRVWWAENPFGFSAQFRSHVEKLITP